MLIAMLGLQKAFYRPGLNVRFGGRGSGTIKNQERGLLVPHRTARCFCAGAWDLALVTTYCSVLTSYRIPEISGPFRACHVIVTCLEGRWTR